MLRSIIAASVTVLAFGSLAGCAASAVPSSDVEDQIVAELEKNDAADPSADCPEDLKAEVGAKITCEATADGETFDVDVEVTSVDGNDVKFDMTQVE